MDVNNQKFMGKNNQNRFAFITIDQPLTKVNIHILRFKKYKPNSL